MSRIEFVSSRDAFPVLVCSKSKHFHTSRDAPALIGFAFFSRASRDTIALNGFAIIFSASRDTFSLLGFALIFALRAMPPQPSGLL